MPPIKTLTAFEVRVHVFVDSATSNGLSSVIMQEVGPGGGPPPHMHLNEDETFIPLEGEFELLQEGKWRPIPKNEAVFGPRGRVHTFRNRGKTPGRIMVLISPAGFERYFEEVGLYSPAADMVKIVEISKRYGLTIHPE